MNSAGMSRESALGGFFTLLTKKTVTNQDDPNYYVLDELMGDMPNDEIYRFFKFFSESPRYFNESGFTNVFSVKKALVEYKGEISDRLWKEYGLEEKSVILTDKLLAVFFSLKKSYPISIVEKILDKAEFDKFKNASTQSPIFEPEEEQVVRAIGFYRLYEKNEYDGPVMVKDIVISAYKSIYTKKFFAASPDAPQLGNSGTGEGSEDSPRVVSVLGGTFMRIT